MKIGILIAVILYEVITIVGVGLVLAIKKRKQPENSGDFALANKGLGTIQVGVTLALTMLGSAHIWGTTQNAFNIGAISVWFGIACTVMMVVICAVTGPAIRKVGTTTVPDLFGKLFGGKTRTLTACIMAPLVMGCLCLETQCIAVTFQALTGWPYWLGAVVGGIFGILYVLIAGMKEVSILNLINAAFMYVALIIAFIAMFFYLPEGWEGVQSTVESTGNTWMLSIFGNSDVLLSFAIPSVFCCTLFQGISQMGLQTAIAAKDAKTVKKSLGWAGIVNGCFCIIPALMGIAAFAIHPELSDMLAAPALIVEILPGWVVFLIMGSFLGALLSTFAMTCLCPATVFAHDLYGGLYNKKADDKKKVRIMRIMIVVFGLIAIGLSNFQPTVVTTINWIFTWAVPMFVMAVIGLWWKRNTKAAVITMVVSWIANVVYVTCGIQTILGSDNFHSVYLCLIISVVLGIVLTAVLPGGKKGLLKVLRERRDAKNAGVAAE